MKIDTGLKLLALICVLPLAGCPVAPIPSVASDSGKEADKSWKGEYRGPKMVVIVEQKNDALSGSIALNGKTFALTAAAPKDGGSKGSFESDGATFDVTLTKSGDELVLLTGGTTYTLGRWTPPNPLAGENPLDRKPLRVAGVTIEVPQADEPATPKPVAPKPVAPKPVDGVSTAGWTHFVHPQGLSFDHPPGWTLQQDDSLLLVPNDVVRNADNQVLELYVVNADTADGITDPASAKAVQVLTQQVQSEFPFLQPQGQPERMSCRGGGGAIHSFAGTSPSGQQSLAKVHALIVGDVAVSLYAIGEASLIQKRLTTIRAVFKSYQFKRPARPATPPPAQRPAAGSLDPNLVGYWRHTKIYLSGGFSMTTDHHLLLAADGTCFWNSNSAGGMGGVSVSSRGEGWSYQGTWSASNGTLTQKWASHGTTEVYDYYLEGNTMMYKGRKPKLWKLIRR